MEDRKKKMIAPIVITTLLIIYYIFYFVVLIAVIPVTIMKIIFGIIPVVFAGVLIYVCIQRINEIRSGEEDDLSKY